MMPHLMNSPRRDSSSGGFGRLVAGLIGVLALVSFVTVNGQISSCGVGYYQLPLTRGPNSRRLGQPIATWDNTRMIRIIPNPSGVGPHVTVDPLVSGTAASRNYTSPLFNSPLAATFTRTDPTNNTLLITNSGNNNILELVLSTGAVRVVGTMPAGITPTAITSNSAGTQYAITSWSGGAVYLMNPSTYTITQGPQLSVYHNPAGIAALPGTPNTVTVATNYTGSCITANAGAWLYDTIAGGASRTEVWETCEVTRGLTYVGSTLYMTTASGYVVRVGPAISVVCSIASGLGSGLGLMSSNSFGDLFVADTISAQVYQISPCPAGTASTGGLSTCPACAPGTFAANSGQTVCTACPSGTTTLGTGATSATACVAGSPSTQASSTGSASPATSDSHTSQLDGGIIAAIVLSCLTALGGMIILCVLYDRRNQQQKADARMVQREREPRRDSAREDAPMVPLNQADRSASPTATPASPSYVQMQPMSPGGPPLPLAAAGVAASSAPVYIHGAYMQPQHSYAYAPYNNQLNPPAPGSFFPPPPFVPSNVSVAYPLPTVSATPLPAVSISPSGRILAKFCSQCGTKAGSGPFCSECGSKLGPSQAVPLLPPPPPPPVYATEDIDGTGVEVEGQPRANIIYQ